MARRGTGVLIALFAAAPVFAQDVLSILSDRCFACHGPDARHRMAGLRLDVDGGARAVSEKVLQRIAATDAAKRMPPPYSGKPALTAGEVEAIRSWIKAGAPMRKFWSFVPPRRPDGANSIDGFIRARLEREGLKPSPEADRPTLIRRVSLDLTGIPPTPAEVQAFVNDHSPKAYEKVVDRLLASPRYGERMSFRWMEAARYGDTNGYQTDGNRDMWRWRDWVIDAFNRNMPYDRFTVEQLAGDLLPNATLDQRIASGFNRNHRTTGEGGIIPEEYRVEYVADRAQTTATVWLGLTAGCARCHDHKYDPISQKDFYRLFAYFNQVPNERGFVWNYGPEEPFVKAPLPDQQKRLAELDAKLERARREWDGLQSEIRPTAAAPDWTPTRDLVFRAEGPGEYNGDAAMFDYLQPFTYAAWIEPKAPTGAILTRLDDYMESQGHGLYLIDGKVRMHLTHRFTDLGWRVESVEPVKLGKRQHVAVTYDGKRLAAGVHIYIDGRPVATKVLFDQNNEPFKKKNTPIRVGAGGGLKFDGSVSDARIYKRAVTPEEALALADNAEAKARLAYIEATPRLHGSHAALERAQTERDAFYDSIPTVMVMADGAHRDTFVLKRGAYDAPGEKVAPGIPSALNGPACPDRLCLAEWIVSKSNPLTARVTVNRFWQSFFGYGIVKTVDDFGAQGERPVHPELLDWLAVEFMESGWDVKHMQKLIVMSAAYRQSSAATPALLEKDPDNRLLARGPRVRLGPEVIRDQALAVAGLLTEKVGGPSVKPYQPAGLWQELSGNNGYVQAKGPDLYRRSLYTFWKRTAPHPYMMNFDSPNREQCAVFENRTNSPLQALNLMNDVTFVEAARKLAERMMVEGGATAADRIAYGYDILLARRPDARRAQILQRAYDRFAADFRANPQAADALLKTGESPVRDRLDRADLAAYASVASLLLNMDEAITKE
jgi:hypothetical protein